jgi:hypothetical protein
MKMHEVGLLLVKYAAEPGCRERVAGAVQIGYIGSCGLESEPSDFNSVVVVT